MDDCSSVTVLPLLSVDFILVVLEPQAVRVITIVKIAHNFLKFLIIIPS
ncbi:MULTISPECIES: hypothetical protein [Clostridium]|nr:MULTISPECIES: hypothetical protein [Clostridium]